MLGPAPDIERWEAVIERKGPSCETIRPMLTAYGLRTGDDTLWVYTATDLTAPEVRDKYRRRCQLMAAAPDLLEAAREALSAIKWLCSQCEESYDGECFDGSCTVHKAVARIEAAVGKAEGRDAP